MDASQEIAINSLCSNIDDIEDALQYYTALHHKLDFFITMDKTFRKSGISTLPIYTPDEFINEFL